MSDKTAQICEVKSSFLTPNFLIHLNPGAYFNDSFQNYDDKLADLMFQSNIWSNTMYCFER